MAGITRGTVFGGRYVVQAQVGTGGMATVYRGDDTVLDRPVAIKVMLPQYASDPAFAQRFKQEAHSAASLQNPYIVQVYDWGRDAATGTYYIVMEYLRGTDLKSGVRSHGALAPRKVAQIGAQVCSALAVAHAHDIIHRDIKPQNIMIQPNGDAKVMDFGIARAKNSHLTQTNSVLGTAHYVSPEQAQGKELGPTSDLYSLGVVMYEAATGKLPFDGDDAVSVALKQVNEQPVPPSQVNPNVDDNLEAIILRCMDKDPFHRFQSADELRGVLNNYIAGRPLGFSTYSAGSTARLGGNGGATQVMRGNLNGGAIGTQRLPHTERMTSGYGPTGNGGTGRSSGGTTGGRGPSAGAIAGGIAVAAVVVILIAAVLSLASCNSGTSVSTPTGTSATTTDATTTTATTTDTTTTTVAAETSEVPSVTGLTAQEAKNKLESYGFKLGSTSYDTSDDVTTGKIISQSPEAKEQAEAGTTVNVVISSGGTKVSVDNLLGKTESEALSVLSSSGLVGEHDSSLDDYSSEYDTGLVITYTPANQQVSKDTTVKYGLSLGLTTTVPYNLKGMSEAEARAAVTNAGLLPYVQYVYSDSTAEGYVAYITDTEGRTATRGEYINLYISQGPEPVTTVQLQDYTGWTATTLQGILQDQGLLASVVTGESASSSDRVGSVYATYPTAGTEVTVGSSVTIYAYGAYVDTSSSEETPAAVSSDEE